MFVPVCLCLCARVRARRRNANSRVVFETFPFVRAEVDVTRHAGYACFGVREGDSAAPSPDGYESPDVLVVGARMYARGKRLRPDIRAEFGIGENETFTLRLDRAARCFYYIVKGIVSPVQFTDLADGPLEFVAFLADHNSTASLTIESVRVDAASAAAAAVVAAATTASASPVAAHVTSQALGSAAEEVSVCVCARARVRVCTCVRACAYFCAGVCISAGACNDTCSSSVAASQWVCSR